jgi:hypothetical protein
VADLGCSWNRGDKIVELVGDNAERTHDPLAIGAVAKGGAVVYIWFSSRD